MQVIGRVPPLGAQSCRFRSGWLLPGHPEWRRLLPDGRKLHALYPKADTVPPTQYTRG